MTITVEVDDKDSVVIKDFVLITVNCDDGRQIQFRFDDDCLNLVVLNRHSFEGEKDKAYQEVVDEVVVK
jgi:hypothetical protein